MGNTKLNQIHQKTEIEKTTLNTYLSRLLKLDIIEREYPVTEKVKKKANAQSGLYKLRVITSISTSGMFSRTHLFWR